jgi:hypothetical protein
VRTDEADRLLAETLENGASKRHRLQEEELYRLKGELLLKTPHNEPDAEPYCLRAMEIARAQSAKWCALCATVSLARMLAKHGQRGEARDARRHL